MKKVLLIAVALSIGWLVGAQTLAPPWQVGVPTAATHTACTVSPGVTQMCLASDGLWLSIAGAGYAQVQTGVVAAGVTSITVNSGTKQTGDVVLTIPSKALTTATTTATTVLQ